MSLPGKTIEAPAAEAVEVEVLFREARQRRRRRRMAALAVVCVVAVSAWLIVRSPGGPGGTGLGRSGPQGSGSTGSSRQQEQQAASAQLPAMNGKYVPTSPAVLGGGQELLAIGGFSFLGKEPFASWFERSADGGLTWHASPASRSQHGPSTMDQLAFIDGQRGWGGQWWTSDSGAVWRRWLPRGDFVDLVRSGSSAWADILNCHLKACDRRDLVETVAGPGASPHPLPAQPPLTIQPDTLVHPSTATGYVLSSGRTGADRMVVEASRDTGVTWQVHDTPCQEPAATGAFPDFAASGPDDLWLVCQNSIEPDESLSTVYRSRDGGTSWTRQSPQPFGENVTSLSAVNGQVAWALSTPRDGSTSVLRTSNGGRSFTTVLDSRLYGFGTNEMTVLSPTSATLSGFEVNPNGGRLELVYTTHDSGHTWERSALPAPPGIPTTGR